jgi:hypothetical protein
MLNSFLILFYKLVGDFFHHVRLKTMAMNVFFVTTECIYQLISTLMQYHSFQILLYHFLSTLVSDEQIRQPLSVSRHDFLNIERLNGDCQHQTLVNL